MEKQKIEKKWVVEVKLDSKNSFYSVTKKDMPMLNNFQIKFKLITLYLNKHFMKKNSWKYGYIQKYAEMV